MQRPLVRLVHDHHTILFEVRVPQRLPQQHAVGHVLDLGFVGRDVFKSNRVADLVAQLAADLLRDARRDAHRRDPSRLRARHTAVLAEAVLSHVLRELRRLAASGLADHDHDLVVPDHGQDVVAHGEGRQRAPLLRYRLARRELRRPRVRRERAALAHVLRVGRRLPVVEGLFFFFLRRRVVLLLLIINPQRLAHARAPELPEPVAHLLPVARLAHLPQQGRPVPRVRRHVARRVLDRRHDVALHRELDAPVEERRPELVHEQRHALGPVVIEGQLGLALRRDARRHEPVLLPRRLVLVQLRPPRAHARELLRALALGPGPGHLLLARLPLLPVAHEGLVGGRAVVVVVVAPIKIRVGLLPPAPGPIMRLGPGGVAVGFLLLAARRVVAPALGRRRRRRRRPLRVRRRVRRRRGRRAAPERLVRRGLRRVEAHGPLPRLRVDAEARPPRPRRRRRGPAVPLGLRRALRLRERLQAQRGRGGPAERRPGALDEAAGLVRGRAPERLGRRAREAQDRRPGPAPGRGGGLVALGRELQRRVPEPLADAVQELRRELRADRRQGLGLGQERLLRPLLRRLLERGEAVAHEGPAQRAVRARQLQRAGQLRGQLLGEAGVLRHAVVRAPRRERGRRRHAVLALFSSFTPAVKRFEFENGERWGGRGSATGHCAALASPSSSKSLGGRVGIPSVLQAASPISLSHCSFLRAGALEAAPRGRYLLRLAPSSMK